MNKTILVVCIFSIFLGSCGSESMDTGEDVEIKIDVAHDLKEDIQIISAVSQKPGLVNPVETSIILKNESDTEKKVLLKSSWHDAHGGFYSGRNTILNLPPGHIEKYQDGTRSQKVSIYKLVVALTEQTEDDLIMATLTDKNLQIAEGHGMTYTETPTKDEIPSWTPRGVANGEPFQAHTILFRQLEFPKWVVEISDRKIDAVKGPAYARFEYQDIQTIYLNLSREPTAGEILEQNMSYGGGIFQIKTSPSAIATTSWNTSIAYIIEITSWNKKPSGKGSCGNADIGTASGRLYINFKGSEFTFNNSWLSGVFENVPISYCGISE